MLNPVVVRQPKKPGSLYRHELYVVDEDGIRWDDRGAVGSPTRPWSECDPPLAADFHTLDALFKSCDSFGFAHFETH